jgi:hypothetical protein
VERESGFTLVDVVIAAAIVVVIVGLAYPGFKVANDTMATGGTQDRMERQGDKVYRVFCNEFRSGFVELTSAAGAAPELSIRRVREDVLLSDLASGGEVPWEADTRTLRFRQTDVFDEAATDQDLNRDGDKADSFALGTVELVETVSGEEVVRALNTTSRVVLGLPNFVEDLDGDGLADPLVTIAGRRAMVELHLMTRTEAGQVLQTVIEGGMRLRNPQD